MSAVLSVRIDSVRGEALCAQRPSASCHSTEPTPPSSRVFPPARISDPYTPRGMLARQDYKRRNTMCRQVACKKCGKTTWAGCGQHVDQVMRGVKSADRCRGHEGEVSTKTSFFAKLFGR